MGKRTKKRSCPNPLFLKFLQEWRDEAREKGRTNLQHAYHKAFSSIQKYPLPLRNGQEAMILEGIGPNIAKKLDEALASYQENSGLEVYEVLSVQTTADPPQETEKPVKDNQTKKKVQKKPTEYAPGYRTGAYALLLTLHKHHQNADYPGFMSKDELQKKAQLLSDKSFTLPDPGCRYTAWSSMSTLIKKGLVIKTSNPAKYSLTPDGSNMAEKITVASATNGPISSHSQVPFVIAPGHPCPTENKETQSDCDSDDHVDWIAGKNPTVLKKPVTTVGCVNVSPVREEEVQSYEKRNEMEFTPEFILRPGTFDIVLCVDFIETTGGSSKSRKDALVKELQSNGVDFDIRKLQVGDFLWIAREKTRHSVPGVSDDSEPKELVLDYIIERKRMDDLNSSIIDGRFREQKFRLRNCGLRHPIYLVEDFGSAQHLSLPEATLKQAIVNTQVTDGFFVKRTHDIKESVAYLTLMTRFIHNFYSGKTLIACPRDEVQKSSDGSHLINSKATSAHLLTFQEFSKETSKNKVVTVSEMFGKQLMQISGVSAEKAAAVLGSYPTPKCLLEGYDSQPTIEQKETMLSCLKFGKQQRNIGPSLSKLIYQLYCTRKALS
ncbi:crossover junction endonuclease MUS81-like isoform X2 [Actinia tenebrosa]|uniref:Crossover junction endonuclease MUS81 n=1 Tax=Actinia tenebrosa TaxID=6105 RepID=A0A6P8H8M1_ACTTE|nr:crossover junction endonuclease MUS81-like isoform X2 [Actinia tenebrosa]